MLLSVEQNEKMCHYRSQQPYRNSKWVSVCFIICCTDLAEAIFPARTSSGQLVHIKKRYCSAPTRLTKGHLLSSTPALSRLLRSEEYIAMFAWGHREVNLAQRNRVNAVLSQLVDISDNS